MKGAKFASAMILLSSFVFMGCGEKSDAAEAMAAGNTPAPASSTTPPKGEGPKSGGMKAPGIKEDGT